MKNVLNKNLEGGCVNSQTTLSLPKPFDLLVFIGRFQPFHKGHERVVEKALKISNNILILVGSSNTASSIRNPFSFEERKLMINSVFPDAIIRPIGDYTYNDTKWTTKVSEIVTEVGLAIANGGGFSLNGMADIKVGLIGCEKDHTSYYLKLFPQWKNVGVKFLAPLNATEIRKMWFNDNWERAFLQDNIVSKSVFDIIELMSEKWDRLTAEYNYIKQYKSLWGSGAFLTADSLVQVGGNILLIKRGREYGHGLYALPGGFLGGNEKFLDGAIRELKEETRLKVPVPVLKGSLKSAMVFEEPHRSERGRIVTVCHHFMLENELELPEVRGDDDADWAGFVDFSSLEEKDFFEDHYHIIRKMMGL